MFWLFLAAFYFILLPGPSLVSDSTRHWNIAPDLRTGEGLLVSCSHQWPASPPLSRPHLSKLQTVQRAMEQTSHYAIITSTTLNTLSTLIIGLHLECQVLFFKSDGCLTFNRDWSANENIWTKQSSLFDKFLGTLWSIYRNMDVQKNTLYKLFTQLLRNLVFRLKKMTLYYKSLESCSGKVK